MLSDALSQDPLLEVAATAASGRIALAKIPLVRPEVVVLDVDMPDIDGLGTLAAIRRSDPRLPVILFSALTEHGAAVTLEGLLMGASDYVTKPSCAGEPASVEKQIRGELIPRIKAMRQKAVASNASPAPAGAPASPAPTPRSCPSVQPAVEVVAIGASTGGPAVLCDLLPRLPADFPAPILIAQHMPPIFTKLLSERLDAISAIGVVEGDSADTLRPGAVWVAPGDFHMVVERSVDSVLVQKNKGPLRNSCRPSVDALFDSVATAFGAGSLAVVLTGMGQDGLEGSRRIREAGGQVLVQDEGSSVVWGMPGAVARAGLASAVVSLDQLAPELIRRVKAGRPSPRDRRARVVEEHE